MVLDIPTSDQLVGFSPQVNPTSWWNEVGPLHISPVGGPGFFDIPEQGQLASLARNFSTHPNLTSWWATVFDTGISHQLLERGWGHLQISPVGGPRFFRHTQIGSVRAQLAHCRLPTLNARLPTVLRSRSAAPAPSGRAVMGGLGGRSRGIDRKTTKSLKLRYGTNRLAHFVWEKCHAQTTHIVKDVPRKTFCTL